MESTSLIGPGSVEGGVVTPVKASLTTRVLVSWLRSLPRGQDGRGYAVTFRSAKAAPMLSSPSLRSLYVRLSVVSGTLSLPVFSQFPVSSLNPSSSVCIYSLAR